MAEVPLHIVQRGHNRQPCFFRPDNYTAYLEWLDEAALQAGCQIHAYALMTNHVHLLVTPREAKSVARMMVSLGRRYVPYVNASYRRSGTLWEGRYKASLVQADAYLLTCMRYIELNPVRAGMCADPAHYPWSSYRGNALGAEMSLITPHPLYAGLGHDDASRQSAYQALFNEVLPDQVITDIRQAVTQMLPLGDSRFLAAIEQVTGQKQEPRPRGRPRKLMGVQLHA